MTQQCPDCADAGILGTGNGKCAHCYGIGKIGTIADDIAGGKRPCPHCSKLKAPATLADVWFGVK